MSIVDIRAGAVACLSKFVPASINAVERNSLVPSWCGGHLHDRHQPSRHVWRTEVTGLGRSTPSRARAAIACCSPKGVQEGCMPPLVVYTGQRSGNWNASEMMTSQPKFSIYLLLIPLINCARSHSSSSVTCDSHNVTTTTRWHDHPFVKRTKIQ